MSKVTSEEFLHYVEKSRLVDAEVLAPFAAAMREKYAGGWPDDPVEVAKQFESAKLLTRWHCEKLLQGRYKGFFLGKHKLLGHLGTGGMSTVYLAEHMVMHHKRAVKVLPKSKLGKNSYLQRFRLEAKAIASLNHPNIVRAYDIDNEKDTHYLVMEFVDGVDLQTLVRKKGPLDFDLAADYACQAAKGLHHAHEHGLIHRDVKPANLLINRDGVIKVLDLGLALYADESQASLTMEHNDKVLGTADYLAPEQALNSHNIDFRADIYGLGCSLYYLLTGHPPFPSGSIAQRIAKHQTTMPDDIRKDRPDCPGELDGICVKMMQKDKRFRYQDCQQVAQVLETWLVSYRKSMSEVNDRSRRRVLSPVGDDGLGGLGLNSSGVRLTSDQETVSNRGGDTMSGSGGPKSGSFMAISASDSGLLRSIAANGGSDVASKIDLEHDSSLPNPHRAPAGDSKPDLTSRTRVQPGAASGSYKSLNLQQLESPASPAKSPTAPARPAAPAPRRKRRPSILLPLIFAAAVGLVLAAAIVYLLGR